MKKIPVIFDCDPGNDDALALIAAFASPALDIRAVTVCAGNVGLDKTLINAKRLLRFLNLRSAPPNYSAGSSVKVPNRLRSSPPGPSPISPFSSAPFRN